MEFTLAEQALLNTLGVDKKSAEIIVRYKVGLLEQSVPVKHDFSLPIKNIKGIQFQVRQGNSNAAIEHLRQVFIPNGYQAYFSRFNDYLTDLNTITILQTNDQMDIIKYHSTNGLNYEISPQNLIDKIEEWNNRYGLSIVGANIDWILFSLDRLPEDVYEYVDELIDFCPDLLQDFYSERGERWSRFLIRGRIYYQKIVRLWWD